MIDPTKIRVGDEVTVRGEFLESPDKDGDVMVGMSNSGGHYFIRVQASRLGSHTPAPRPFVVGGKVRHKEGRSDDICEVRAIVDEKWLLLKYIGDEMRFVGHADLWEPCE